MCRRGCWDDIAPRSPLWSTLGLILSRVVDVTRRPQWQKMLEICDLSLFRNRNFDVESGVGPLLGTPGPLLGALGPPMLGCSWTLWGLFGAALMPVLGALKPLWGILGSLLGAIWHSRTIRDPCGAHLRLPGNIFGHIRIISSAYHGLVQVYLFGSSWPFASLDIGHQLPSLKTLNPLIARIR